MIVAWLLPINPPIAGEFNVPSVFMLPPTLKPDSTQFSPVAMLNAPCVSPNSKPIVGFSIVKSPTSTSVEIVVLLLVMFSKAKFCRFTLPTMPPIIAL